MVDQQTEGEGNYSVRIAYTNWRDEATTPLILPRRIFWGSNEYHPEPCWLIEAIDIEKDEFRTYDLAKIGARPADRPGDAAVPVAYMVDYGQTGDGWDVRIWTARRRSEAEGCAKAFGVAVVPLYAVAPTPPAPVKLGDMEVRVGGAYRMPDGRSFWIDGATAREIAKRALGLSPSSNDRLSGGQHDR